MPNDQEKWHPEDAHSQSSENNGQQQDPAPESGPAESTETEGVSPAHQSAAGEAEATVSEESDPVMDLPEIPAVAPAVELGAAYAPDEPEAPKKKGSFWRMFAAAVALVAVGAGVGSATTVMLGGKYLNQKMPIGYEVTQSNGAKAISQTPFESENVIPDVYRRVAPSVVKINVYTQNGWSSGEGTGSGFVVDERGYILTNYHVIENASRIRAKFIDDTEFEAEVVGTDRFKDLAVIKVDPGDRRLIPAVLGDSDTVQVGELAIAIGSPFGQEWTVTAGIVSALNRDILGENSPWKIPGAIQTDASINPGNSGGPLLNADGQVIGINTAIEAPVRGSVGIGFAVPVNAARDILPTLMAGNEVQYAYLGVSLGDMTPELAEQVGASVKDGAVIAEVMRGTPADAAGLRSMELDRNRMPVSADVVVAIDGKPIKNADDLVDYVQSKRVGDEIVLTVVRGSERVELTARLSSRPDRNP